MTSHRIVVTGGSGFIGTHLITALLEAGYQVTNLDRKRPALIEHLPHWIEADLMDDAGIMHLITEARPTLIYNLAAVADIALDAAAMAPNTQGLRHVIRAAQTAGSVTRLVHASTQLVVRPDYSPAHPRDFAPYTEYGESKAQSETILWEEAGDLPWTIVRPATIWGPWHASFGKSIWKYLNRRWYLLPTGIDPVRSYGYVGNVVAQLLAIPDAPADAVDRAIFYLGDEPQRSSTWLDGFSQALTGKPTRRVPGAALKLLAEAGEFSRRIGGPAPIDRGRLYRMTTDYPVPMAETFRVLGCGSIEMEEGIAKTIAWLRTNQPDEYQK